VETESARAECVRGTSELGRLTQRLAALTLLVRDYDEALAFFVGALGFELLEDTPLREGKRWVRVRPPGRAADSGMSLLLARAATPEQQASVGDQTGGRVFLFLETDDFRRDYERWRAKGERSSSSRERSRMGRWRSSRTSMATVGT
jgi:hypothetical protein